MAAVSPYRGTLTDSFERSEFEYRSLAASRLKNFSFFQGINLRRVEEFHIYRCARSFGRIFIRSRGSNEGVEKRKTVNGKKDETVERGIELIMPRIRKKIYRV